MEVRIVGDDVEGNELDTVGERVGQGFALGALESFCCEVDGAGELFVQVSSGTVEDSVDASNAGLACGVVDVFSCIFWGCEFLEGQLFAALSFSSVGLSRILSTTLCFAKTIFTMLASRVPDRTGCITFTIIFWP